MDKAAKNVAIICKRFYLEVLFRELGLMGTSSNATYSKIDSPLQSLLKEHQGLFSKCGIDKPTENQQKLPFMYWIPKFHKTPTKFRFIVASFCCTSKPLSAALTIALKEVQRMSKLYCKRIQLSTGINQMWIADNSGAVLETISHINRHSKAKTIATYDFSTLYTSIPHKALKSALQGCIERAFKGGAGKFLTVNGQFASWGSKPSSKRPSFSAEQLIQMTKTLIDNIFFTVGPAIFRQNIGIPMGTDCAPFLANLFLHFHEDRFISFKRSEKWRLCQLLSHNNRYIDDMLVVNAGEMFDRVKDEIYPQELVLNKENSEKDHAHFLDMDISIIDGRFSVKLYDKRDSFPFKIVNFPHLNGNIPQRIGTSVLISQLVRYSKCTLLLDFLKNAGKLFHKVRKQFFSDHLIKTAVKRFLQNHFTLMAKYGFSRKALSSLMLSS